MAKKLTFIDLFAGAGGLSEGFIRAGYEPIAHVEMDEAACYTLKTRAAYYYLKRNNRLNEYHKYLKGELTRKEFYKKIPDRILESVINQPIGDKTNKDIFKKIDELKRNRSVDLIIGGPPCQAYSLIGRAALKHKKVEDERTTLYKHYGRFLKKYQPKLFVFENVPGIKTADEGKHYRNLKKYFKQIGYELDDRLINSYEFGVVQRRERLIIIGWKDGLDFSYPEFKGENSGWTRDSIFADLPPVKPNHSDPISFYCSPTNEYLVKSEIRNGVDFVTQHVTRPHNERDLNIYKLAIAKLEEEGKRLKNNEIPEEDRTQKNTKDFLDRFKVVDVLPHTMIAHIAKDGHHFIHPDKKQVRSISVREAARIQSFPDDYYFEGVNEKQYRTPAFKQIGNAVPPVMANKIAKAIRSQFEKV